MISYATRLLGAIACVIPMLSIAQDTDSVTREYMTLDWTEDRAFSPVVATTGGKTIWLAGVTTPFDAEGNSLAGDFEAQTREIFRVIEERLEQFGGTLADIVTMTVYIGDTRFGDPFVEIRKEMFEPGRYPSSALITVTGFARPEILIEIKAIAVVDAD
ncbi:MAG TPA: RidA family protein [Gammaproteobacteria bacterium]